MGRMFSDFRRSQPNFNAPSAPADSADRFDVVTIGEPTSCPLAAGNDAAVALDGNPACTYGESRDQIGHRATCSDLTPTAVQTHTQDCPLGCLRRSIQGGHSTCSRRFKA